MGRPDGRPQYTLRPVTITRGFIETAEGSVLIACGRTKVICTASVDDTVPPFLRNANHGWVTAEYGMLPKSSRTRIPRESGKGQVGGRTHEIQRLIGRSLRAVMDLHRLGERTIWIDCDVIQADGGTRTAAITGACVALVDALRFLREAKLVQHWPLRDLVSAVSVGVIDGKPALDLVYAEDSIADVDCNVVMTAGGRFVEIQGTAEGEPFDHALLQHMLELAQTGIKALTHIQRTALGDIEKY